jgi:hypothetical protein
MAIRQVRTINVERARNLLVQAVLDHKDASTLTISPYRRLTAAYEASLHCCLAVLALSKEEASGSEGHNREILERACEILGLENPVQELLAISKIRNGVQYKGAYAVDEQTIGHAIRLAERMLAETESWVRKHQPYAL